MPVPRLHELALRLQRDPEAERFENEAEEDPLGFRMESQSADR